MLGARLFEIGGLISLVLLCKRGIASCVIEQPGGFDVGDRSNHFGRNPGNKRT